MIVGFWRSASDLVGMVLKSVNFDLYNLSGRLGKLQLIVKFDDFLLDFSPKESLAGNDRPRAVK